MEQAVGQWRVLAPVPLAPVEPGELPTLSVVIPYYKGADVIREAVQSVLDQTLQPDEIVICDDGSPDDLEAALGPLRPRVKILRKENGGAASAMNAATRAAESELVVLLDQDDVFLPRRLEAIATASAARPDLDLIATDALIEFDGEAVARFSEKVPFRAEGQRTEILWNCFFAWPTIRRSKLLAAGGFDESHTTGFFDWACYMRLILSGACVGLVDEPLYVWKLRTGSLSSDPMINLEALVAALTDLRARRDLEPAERGELESAIAARQTSLARLRARRALENSLPDARRRSLELLLGRNFGSATRAKAALGVASPALARRLLVRRSKKQDPTADAFDLRMPPG